MYAGTDRLLVAQGSLGGDSCTICISDFQDGQHVSVLPCDHRFCPECIDQWFAVSTLCPCCKQDAMIDDTLLIRDGKFQCHKVAKAISEGSKALKGQDLNTAGVCSEVSKVSGQVPGKDISIFDKHQHSSSSNPFSSNPVQNDEKFPPEELEAPMLVSEEKVVQLTSMGFPQAQVVKALQVNNNDLQEAMEFLMKD